MTTRSSRYVAPRSTCHQGSFSLLAVWKPQLPVLIPSHPPAASSTVVTPWAFDVAGELGDWALSVLAGENCRSQAIQSASTSVRVSWLTSTATGGWGRSASLRFSATTGAVADTAPTTINNSTYLMAGTLLFQTGRAENAQEPDEPIVVDPAPGEKRGDERFALPARGLDNAGSSVIFSTEHGKYSSCKRRVENGDWLRAANGVSVAQIRCRLGACPLFPRRRRVAELASTRNVSPNTRQGPNSCQFGYHDEGK